MTASSHGGAAIPGDQGPYRSQAGTATETLASDPIHRLPGAKRPVGEFPYMELLDHSKRLGRLVRRDWGRAFEAAGVLLLGAGLGALASGQDIDQTGVLLTLVAGVILIVSAFFIGRERVESASDLKADFDQKLSFYEHDEDARRMKERYGSDPVSARWGRTKRLLHRAARSSAVLKD